MAAQSTSPSAGKNSLGSFPLKNRTYLAGCGACAIGVVPLVAGLAGLSPAAVQWPFAVIIAPSAILVLVVRIVQMAIVSRPVVLKEDPFVSSLLSVAAAGFALLTFLGVFHETLLVIVAAVLVGGGALSLVAVTRVLKEIDPRITATDAPVVSRPGAGNGRRQNARAAGGRATSRRGNTRRRGKNNRR